MLSLKSGIVICKKCSLFTFGNYSSDSWVSR